MAQYVEPTIYDAEQAAWYVSTEPTVEPITLSDAKLHCRVDGTDDNDLITALVKAARQYAESITNRAFITQTRVLKLDKFPPLAEQVIELPGGKLQSVSSITYVDTDGTTQTWSSSNYTVNTATEPGRIELAYEQDWPDAREWGMGITITYVCGWAGDGGSPEDLTANVPESIKQAIRMMVAHWYEHREASGQQMQETPIGARALLAPYMLKRLFS